MKRVNLLAIVSGFFFCVAALPAPKEKASEEHMQHLRRTIEERIQQIKDPKVRERFQKELESGKDLKAIEADMFRAASKGVESGKGGSTNTKGTRFEAPKGEKKPALKFSKPAGATHENGEVLGEVGRKSRPEAEEGATEKIKLTKEQATKFKKEGAAEEKPHEKLEKEAKWAEFRPEREPAESVKTEFDKIADAAVEGTRFSGEEAADLKGAIRMMLKKAEAMEKAKGKTLDLAEIGKIVKDAVAAFEAIAKEIPEVPGHENAGKNFTRNMLLMFHRNPKALASQIKKLEGYLKNANAEEKANILKGQAFLVEAFGEPFLASLKGGSSVAEAHKAGLKMMVDLMKSKLNAEEMAEILKCMDGGPGGTGSAIVAQGLIS